MNQVVVFYNPFLPELKISVNGKKLSSYSSLMSYRHERFGTWCHNLFLDLYRELNSDYELVCVSTDFIANWLETLSLKNPHCVSFSRQPLPMEVGIYERLAKLELLGCENSEINYVPIINASEDDEMISAVYEILEEQGVFEDISEDGIVWSECPLVNVELVTCDSFYDIPRDYSCAIVLCGSEDDRIDMEGDVPTYALVMGTETRFLHKKSGTLYFSVDPDDIGAMMVCILEEEVLCPVLSDLSYRFSSDDIAVLTESEKEELALICQASPSCKASIPAECDVGRIVDIHPQVFPSDESIRWRVVSSAPEILEADDGILTPRSAGVVEISIFLGDDPYPAVTETVRVLQRELITSIQLFPSLVYMPVGGTEQVSVSIVPEYAQNRREIVWESSNPSIAEVDPVTGLIRGNECGVCTVTASTQETSSRVTVHVQAELEDIICPGYFIEVGAGEQKEWHFRTVPENAYGVDLIRIITSDSNIAEYRGGYIIGKNIGECRIYIKTQDGFINRELHVRVRKGNKFR